MRMPAKIRPPRQMTAPAYMANVLNVPMRVCAPEKSIVPWAFAVVANVRATRIGPRLRAVRNRLCLDNDCPNLLASRGGKVGEVWAVQTILLRDIGTSNGVCLP